MRLLTYLPILIFLITASCKNDDASAPSITEGNSFSCKINGKLFVPEDHGGFPIIQEAIIVNISEHNNWYFKFGNGDGDVYIYLANVTSIGNYRLEKSDGDGDFFQMTNNLMEADLDLVNSRFGTTHISNSTSGTVKVLELDIGNRIVLEFDEIILEGINNNYRPIALSEGKLNINLETLLIE